MPIPLIAIGAAAAGAGLTVAKVQLHRALMRNHEQIEKWALAQVWEKLGLPDLTDEGGAITRQSFTQALNDGPLAATGVKLTDVFDKAQVRRDLERHALERAAAEFGIGARSLDVDGLKDAMRKYVAELIEAELAKPNSELIKDAKALASLVRIIKTGRRIWVDAHGNAAPPQLKMDEQSIKNRERQAKYRSAHKRVWVARETTEAEK